MAECVVILLDPVMAKIQVLTVMDNPIQDYLFKM